MKLTFLPFLTLICFCINCNSQKEKALLHNNTDYSSTIENSFTTRAPLFFIQYYFGKVKLEIYINDCLLVRTDKYSIKSQEYLMLNHLLIPNKEQSLKIKFFPQEEVFDANSSILLQLHRLDSKKNWNERDFSSQKTIIKYDSLDEINLKGKSYFEKEFTFTIDQELADTSPNLNALAKNLSTIDTTLLKKQLLKKYRQLISSVKQQDRALFNEIYSGKTELFAQYNQLNKEEIEGLKEEADFIFKETELILNDDVEMFFYGNDRIISLENIKDRKPALSFKYKAEDDNYYSIEMPLYFYIPKDSTELKILY